MARDIVRGNKALAERLGVSLATIAKWRQTGLIDNGVAAEYGRVIIYDVDMVLNCLKYRTVKPGRPRKRV